MRETYKTDALLLTAVLALPRAACGYDYDFTDGKLCYNRMSETECEVVNCISGLSGPVIILSEAKDDSTGATYSVTSIGRYAFAYCDGLTSMTIPNSVTSIGVEAFNDCYSHASIHISNSVTHILQRAFAGCYGIRELYAEPPVPSPDVRRASP